MMFSLMTITLTTLISAQMGLNKGPTWPGQTSLG
jgi:hypothetical protein